MAGNVGRPPKPASLKLVTGHKSTAIKPRHESVFKAGTPPSHLNTEALAEWQRIAPILEEWGLITEEESTALALYCQAFGRWQQAERQITALCTPDGEDGLIVKAPSGYPIQNPYLAIANKAMEQCYQYLQQFGLSPSARARVDAIHQGDLFDDAKTKSRGYFS